MFKLQIDKEKRYLIAVSGGPDSMALFDMTRKSKAHIEVAHVNYHKRETAKRDEEIVRAYCLKYDIPFHLYDFEAEKYEGNFQAAARNARYDFFSKICKEEKLDEVLIAHQKDDLIETYLMQKERKLGVSYYGLRQRNIINGVSVYRPLLEYTKKELLEYCGKNKIDYGIDESNLSDDYERNRIRHTKIDRMTDLQKDELVKIIESENRKKEEHYLRAIEVLNKNVFTVSQFKKVPYFFEFLSVHFPSSRSKQKEMKRQLIESKNCLFEGKDYCLCKEYDQIYVFEKKRDYEYVIKDKKELLSFHFDAYHFEEAGEKIQGFYVREDEYPLTIRNVRQGDQIQMRYGRKKLNRFFIDKKIPYMERLSWPLIANKEGTVIFVHGLGCEHNHYCEKESVFMIKL